MRIKEVCEKYGLTPDTLRFYEKIGLLPRVRRDKNGIRDYSEEDCRWIEFIKCMRSAGIEIEALVRYVKLFQEGDATLEERKQILIEQRDKLQAKIEEMQKALERLNYKIQVYETHIKEAERKLKKTVTKV
ncbi:MerR family transcriptional regulator [Dictyoglomus thermophilum]|uniref:Transcriptional regulator, MerR family n=2 Tax=Dictyoglomus thermophilum TaxID=14 RepID=B5YAS4_DICT6|nr:MerR family transcriptional regulator [Dictyoglomus thermophilum]ACI19116.1 transcriptional regulator, MerR family [Dictyoglomus thermophilum H-6-12]TYT24003.1 MerR family transcriptional regulator [Dictyoglomus thermophilum]